MPWGEGYIEMAIADFIGVRISALSWDNTSGVKNKGYIFDAVGEY